MCGIGGILFPESGSVDVQTLTRMGESIKHRGPDQEGCWMNEEKTVGFIHKRLSVIDLSENGRQPMHYLNRYTIVFNGEIYNYIELREELKKKGEIFKTNTDTEVILTSFHLYRENCLSSFNGMFAFAIWDNDKKELFCARDRFGEKPFFYNHNGRSFIFGSEIKALFAAGVPRSANNQMLYRYLKWDLVENPEDPGETFFKGVQKLPPSCYLFLNNNEITISNYWDIDLSVKSPVANLEETAERYLTLFRDSVRIRLRSDVPVGSSLSGGVDSSSIVASVNSAISPGQRQCTFSARFSEKEFDEGYYIDNVTKRYNVDPYFVYPDESGFIEQVEKIYYHQEEPFGSASIAAQWEVMKLARKNNVTVLLDGQGADEILAGYEKYPEVFLREMMLRSRKLFRAESAGIKNTLGLNYKAGLLFMAETFSPSLLRFAGRVKRNLTPGTDKTTFGEQFLRSVKKERPPFRNYNTLNETLYYDTMKYGLKKLLRYCDRNAMAFGVEVRLPFLDYRLVEFVFSLSSEFKIKEGFSKYIHRYALNKDLPAEICWRKDKLSYQVPQNKWLTNKTLAGMITSSDIKLKKEGILAGGHKHDPWQTLMASYII